MTSEPTEFQRALAKTLGMDISKDNREIAAARINEYTWPAVFVRRTDLPPTKKQADLAKEIEIDITDCDRGTAAKKIGARLELLNEVKLRELNLAPGDKVRFGNEKRVWVVSCVGRNRRIYLKGVGGQSCWAHNLGRA